MSARNPARQVARVVSVISGFRYRYTSEAELQESLRTVLDEAGLAVTREVALRPEDRVDFMVGRVAVEVKVAGSTAQVARQLRRYARHDGVDAIVLVTSRASHARVEREINGKPVAVVALGTR